MTRTNLALTEGRWSRFDRYEIREGRIAPVAGSALSAYDPWSERSKSERPHDSLLELAQQIRLLPQAGTGLDQLDNASEKLVLDWVHSYGLLGVLPHCVLTARLAARWAPGFPGLGLWPMSRIFVPGSLGWRATAEHRFSKGGKALVGEPELEGELVPLEALPPDWRPPTVVLRELGGFEVTEETFEEYWVQFFPHVPPSEASTYAYPLPTNETFWHTYQEPVHEFIRAASVLRNAVDGLSRAQAMDQIAPEDAKALYDGRDTLHALVAGVRPAVLLSESGAMREVWVSSSLLGSLAMMVLQDFTSGAGRIRRCERCSNLYIARSYQSKYCSDRCMWASQKDRYRKRKAGD